MKQWTAQDVKMDNELRTSKTKNEEGDDTFTLVIGYRFVDGAGNNIPGLGHQRLVRKVLWNDVPTTIKNAFTKQRQWAKNEALAEQGME